MGITTERSCLRAVSSGARAAARLGGTAHAFVACGGGRLCGRAPRECGRSAGPRAPAAGAGRGTRSRGRAGALLISEHGVDTLHARQCAL
ncbi:hypothetical protein M885DRAFT_557854 [Pelagophyceae sp. CCMP2097]|nr:hypothetical protein M885DRAFT_557854 [Pelagophyceae sp. CCMP2097]